MELRDVSRAKRHIPDPRIPILQRRKLRCREGWDFPEAPQLCLEGPGEWPVFPEESWAGGSRKCGAQGSKQASAGQMCVGLQGNSTFNSSKVHRPSAVTVQGPVADRESTTDFERRLVEGIVHQEPPIPQEGRGLALAWGRAQRRGKEPW